MYKSQWVGGNWAPWLSGHSELEAAALHKAVWWDLRLSGLLTHLLVSPLLFFVSFLFCF